MKQLPYGRTFVRYKLILVLNIISTIALGALLVLLLMVSKPTNNKIVAGAGYAFILLLSFGITAECGYKVIFTKSSYNKRLLKILFIANLAELLGVCVYYSLILASNRVRVDSDYSVCEDHLRQIGIGLRMYADEHCGLYPNSLSDLLKYKYIESSMLKCSNLQALSGGIEFGYSGAGHNINDPASLIIVYEVFPNKGTDYAALENNGTLVRLTRDQLTKAVIDPRIR